MRRAIARWMGWWTRLFVLAVFVLPLVGWPWWLEWPTMAVLLVLAFVRPRGDRDREPVVVAPPVRGRWTALNSPATKVPSHGLRAYGQTYAIDILRPRPHGTPARLGWGLGVHRPEAFPTFGEPVLAMEDGVVVAATRRQRDHRSRTTWPSLAYLLVVEGFLRELGGPGFVLGNHVIVDHGDGVHSAYAHLRRGSVRVDTGDRVRAGEQIGEVGGSGNTSEPHLHVQLMDDPSVTAAAGVPFRWTDVDLPPGEVDLSLGAAPPDEVEPGLPANGQIFTTT